MHDNVGTVRVCGPACGAVHFFNTNTIPNSDMVSIPIAKGQVVSVHNLKAYGGWKSSSAYT